MTRERLSREDYAVVERFATRWRDADAYGHVNNAVFYEYVDTVVNGWLLGSGALDVPGGPVVGFVVASECVYFDSLPALAPVDAGLRAARIGATSVTYRVGLFRADAALEVARAQFTHVCVDRDTRRPVPLPETLRAALGAIAPR